MQGILKLKIDSCVTMPTKRYLALMEDRLDDANRVRNAIVRGWVRWREDNPEWEPQQRTTRTGEPKVNAKGDPVLEHPMISQSKAAELYHVYKEVAPHMSSNVASGCWNEVLSDLKDKMPYNHEGSQYRWQAILNYEVQPPTYRASVLPCPSGPSGFIYTDDRLELLHPLLSKTSGYKCRSPVVRLKGLRSKGISRGNQELLKRIARGELRRADSTLVLQKGEWYYHLCYEVPIKDHCLNKDVVAVVTPMRDSERRPFEMRVAGGIRWTAGDGIAMERKIERVAIRRKSIRNNYKDGAGSGHGKSKFYRAIRPMSRSVVNAQRAFQKHLINEIIRFCVQSGAGTVEYREPTMPLRDCLWFAQRGIPFCWDRFAADLAFNLQKNGISQVFRHERKKLPVRIGKPEHKEEYKSQWETTK